MTGELIDATSKFAARAEAVNEYNARLRIAREAAAPETEWYRRQAQGLMFLRSVGIDLTEISLIPPPDDLESPSTDPQVQEAREVMKRSLARRKGEQ